MGLTLGKLKNNRAYLEVLSKHLLELHMELLEFERKQYEGKHGKISSKASLFNLVTHHPDFSWLHGLSELIISIDPMIEGKADLRLVKMNSLKKYARLLLKPSAKGSNFAKKYFKAMHTEPGVALKHAETIKFLESRTSVKKIL